MNILIVSKCPTHPTTAGNRRFIANQVDLFRRMGHNVFFVYVYEPPFSKVNSSEERVFNEMKEAWGDNLFIFKVNLIEKCLLTFRRHFLRPLFNQSFAKVDDQCPNRLSKYVSKICDRLSINCLIVNYYHLTKILEYSTVELKALTTHDYFSYKNLLVGRNVPDATNAHQEAIAMQRSPNIFALNTEEAILFSKLSPKSKVYNIFSTYDYHPSKVVGNRVMLFLSGPNPYNLNGLKWFVDTILPMVVERIPEAKLRIGGAICTIINEYKSNPNIELVGYVDNPVAFYSGADVVINPTYQGTGLKIKTFESISYDKVTMAHPHSMTGIYKPDKAPIFASTNPKEWVDFLNKVWYNPVCIENYKKLNKEYLNDMQDFIISEYDRFFSSI